MSAPTREALRERIARAVCDARMKHGWADRARVPHGFIDATDEQIADAVLAALAPSPEQQHCTLLADALGKMLVKVGVLRDDVPFTGPDLLNAASAFCESVGLSPDEQRASACVILDRFRAPVRCPNCLKENVVEVVVPEDVRQAMRDANAATVDALSRDEQRNDEERETMQACTECGQRLASTDTGVCRPCTLAAIDAAKAGSAAGATTPSTLERASGLTPEETTR